jgi:signal transduction histidine kinase
MNHLRQNAANEERVRLVRDLHDGLLQSLTGAALQLETAVQLLDKHPDWAKDRLGEIQRLIQAEQRDLRRHIHSLKPSASAPPGSEPPLSERLEDLSNRIERQWGLRASIEMNEDGSHLPNWFSRQIYFVVSALGGWVGGVFVVSLLPLYSVGSLNTRFY